MVCGVNEATPNPSYRDRGRFDAWASRYDRSLLQLALFEPTHRAVLDAAANAGVDPHDLLDIGCGTGKFLEEASRRWPEARLTGVDAAPNMIAEARKKHSGDARFRFEVGDSAALQLADASFDLAVTTVSFHHWSDQAAGVREVARVLRPGGVFVLADIAPPILLALLRLVVKRFHGPDSRRRLFDQAALSVAADWRPLRLAGNVLITVGRKAAARS
jgi:ubiquinone/menaquinone biosynthesis C-methylase UbiE